MTASCNDDRKYLDKKFHESMSKVRTGLFFCKNCSVAANKFMDKDGNGSCGKCKKPTFSKSKPLKVAKSPPLKTIALMEEMGFVHDGEEWCENGVTYDYCRLSDELAQKFANRLELERLEGRLEQMYWIVPNIKRETIEAFKKGLSEELKTLKKSQNG